jgi:hypothetical protein
MSNARENVNLLTSTDWDVATLRLANWGSGAVPPQVVLKTNYVAGDGGGVFRYDASDTTTADDGGIVIVDAAGNRWKRQWDENNAQASWWGATASVSADQSAKIQAGIDWLEARDRGGILLLPPGTVRIDSTLTVERNNITILGQGGDQPHDAGTGARAATILAWYGASGGGSAMVFFRTPSGIGNSRRYGGGFKRTQMDCRTLADYGLRIESWAYAEWHNLDVFSPRVGAYWLTCLVTGTTIAEAGDVQRNDFWACTWRCIDNATTKLAHGFILDGSSNANTSLNIFRSCVGQHFDGTGWLMFNCDNNLLMQCGSFRASGGTGYTFRFKGQSPTAYGGGYSNTLLHCGWSASNGCYVEGTDVAGNTAGPSPPNTFLSTDNANGSQFPTYGTGAAQGIITFDNTSMAGMRQINAPFGESASAATNARTAIAATDSVYIVNGSQSHLVLSDGTNVWSLRLTATTFDILRVAGTAKLNLPAVTALQINGQDVSLGAADSGGTGFKLLRVPN